MGFTEDLQKFNTKVSKKATARLRRVALKAASGIISGTPVLTGTARANWRVSIGFLSREFDLATSDKSGGATINAASGIIQNAKLGVDIFIGNSVPYIIPLEHGYSRQQPGGWVHPTIREIQTMIESGKL